MKKSEKEKQLQGTARPDRAIGVPENIRYLKDLPDPNKIFNITPAGLKWYRFLGTILIKTGRFSELDIPNLILLSVSWSQWEWANGRINEMNAKVPGEGLIQTYQSGATGITAEYVVRKDAENSILRLSKAFGMNFRDRHAIASFFEDNSGQLDLFDVLNQIHPDNNPNLKVIG